MSPELVSALAEERQMAIRLYAESVRISVVSPCEENAMLMVINELVVKAYDAALIGDVGMANFLRERAEVLVAKVAARRVRQIEAAEAARWN